MGPSRLRTCGPFPCLLPDAGEEASFNWKQSGMTGVELLGVLELMKAEVMKAMGVV